MLENNVFSCMEMSGQPYQNVIDMPVKRFQNYLKWKANLEEDKKKMINEEISKRG